MFKLTDTDLRDFAEEIDLEAKRATGRDGRDNDGIIFWGGKLDDRFSAEFEELSELPRLIPAIASSHLLPGSSIFCGQASYLLQTSSLHLQTSSPHLQTSYHLLPMNSEHLERLEQIARPVKASRKVPKEVMVRTILAICNDDFVNLTVLADILDRSPDPLRDRFLNKMVKEGQLELRYPDKPTHPDQGYRAKKQDQEQEARK